MKMEKMSSRVPLRRIQLGTAPATNLTKELVKQATRISTGLEDDFIDSQIAGTEEKVKLFTGILGSEQEWEIAYPFHRNFRILLLFLPFVPFVSIESASVVLTDCEEEEVFPLPLECIRLKQRNILEVTLKEFRHLGIGEIRINYTAGADYPSDVLQDMVASVAWDWNNRGDCDGNAVNSRLDSLIKRKRRAKYRI